jgi:hypothetical protein
VKVVGVFVLSCAASLLAFVIVTEANYIKIFFYREKIKARVKRNGNQVNLRNQLYTWQN